MDTLRRIHGLQWGLALILALGLWLLLQPLTARADTVPVTSTLDSGVGTLRQAIADAASGDTIVFTGSMSIYLDSELSIAKNLTIDGGVYTVTVSGDSGNDGGPGGLGNVRAFNISAGYAVTLSRLSIVKGNADMGGGIYNKGTLTLQDCTLADNTASYGSGGGGALWNEYGVVTLLGSTVSGNVANNNGGGIMNRYGTVTLRNSTVSGNRVTNGYGGGIRAMNGATILQHSTLAHNTALVNGGGTTNGGGIYQWGVTLSFYNTLIANNTGGDCALTGSGGIAANVNNLVGDGSCSPLLSGDPRLGPLANNGGPSTGSGPATFTHALLPGSPAIDAGAGAHCLSPDQRGVARPISGVCDIGAVEAPAYPRLESTLTVAPTGGVAYDGGIVTYTLVVSNTGPLADPQAQLTDTLPAGVIFRQWVTNPGATRNGDQITWQGTLASQGVLRLVFQATHRYGTTIVNTAAISGLYQMFQATATFTAPCQSALTVASDNDSGYGSLRQAIADVCPGGPITFAGDMSIYLNGELNIAKSMTIDGGAYTVAISGDSGNDASRDVRAFNISAGSVVTLARLTITNCYHSDRGAGIYNAGNLTVIGCHFSNNAGGYGGGAINNHQNLLTVRDSVFSNNAGDYGGAILIYRGNTVIQNSTLSGNSAPNGGGAIYDYQQSGDALSLTVLSSTLSNNSSWYGGGIEARNTPLVVRDSVFISNTARYYGGGINFDCTNSFYTALTVDNSTFVGNTGGTVYEQYTRGGGGIYNYYGNMTIRNSTFSGNAAPQNEGGAIVTWGSLTLLNSTLSGNSSRNESNASGLVNWGDLHIKNTLIASDSPNPDCRDFGTIVTNFNNLVEDGSCSNNGVNFQSGDPALGALADNGGLRVGAGLATPLRTHALLSNSPAIDAGDSATCLVTDQRGFPRADLRCDIGAYELQHADSDTVVKTFADTVTHSFGPTWVRVTLSAADTGALTVTKHTACPGGTCDDGEVPATWHITSALSDGLPLTVSFCYTPELASVTDAASLRAFRWDTDTLTWTLPLSTGLTVAEGCVTLTGIEAFSAWTLKDTRVGEDTPTTARVVALAARGFVPLLAGLLALGGAAALFKRKRP